MKVLSKKCRLAFLLKEQRNGEIYKHCLEVMKENLDALGENEKFGLELCEYFKSVINDDRVFIGITKNNRRHIFDISICDNCDLERLDIEYMIDYSENGIFNKSNFKSVIDYLIDDINENLTKIQCSIDLLDEYAKDIRKLYNEMSDIMDKYPRYLKVDLRDIFYDMPTFYDEQY